MPVGNLDQFEAALTSQEAQQLYEAWFFLERIEQKRTGENGDFRQKLREKKIKILAAALELCPPDGKILFFGSREDIIRHQRELSQAPDEPRLEG